MATGLEGTEEGLLRCMIVTPEKTIYNEHVEFVVLPLYDGELGVLPGRAPLMGRLGYGELRTRYGEMIQRLFIEGGFVQVRSDVVTVLTSAAILASKIDEKSAAEELSKTLSVVATNDEDQAAKDQAVLRARAMLRLAQDVD